MKEIFRRIVSTLLAAVMTIGMFPVTALAAPGPADGQVEYVGGSNSAEGHYDIEVSKTIQAVPGKENYFDITLRTVTHRHKVDMSTDVVVVLDVSNTMNSDSNGNEGAANNKKKITFAKNATKTFVNAFCTNENLDSNRKLGIVTFNRDAKVAVGLTEANDISDYNSISASINNITAPTGHDVKWTNIEAGIQLAENILASSKAKFKYIILLTDGFPTTYLKNHNPTGTGTLQGYDPRMSGEYNASKINNEGYFANTRTKQLCTGGTSYSNRAAEYAESAAASAINSGINIFTVGVALASQDIDNFLTYIVDTTGMTANEKYAIGTTESSYKSWLENSIAGGKLLEGTSGVKYSDAYNQNQLEKDFEAILKAIERAPETTLRTFYTLDPMSIVADFIGFFNKNGNLVSGNLVGESKENAENTATFTSSTSTINWDMLKSGFTMEGENLVFSLKYRVRLENESANFSFSTPYDTNNTTTLNYSQRYADGTDVPDGTGTLLYPIPEVEGYKGSLKFRKVDTEGNILPGVKFTLQHYGSGCSVCAGDAPIGDMVSHSGEDGYVYFENIPSGHEYRLIEEIPAGYAPIHNHTIIVSYGKTYLGTLTPENEIVDGKRNGGTGEAFNVINSKIESPELSFSVKKATENLGTLSAGDYSFRFSGTGVNGVQHNEIKSNDANGVVTFDKLVFDIPGNYNFTVSEVIGTNAGTVYDGTVYNINVAVSLNAEGDVTTAVVSVNGTEIGTYVGDKDEDTRIVSLTGENASFTNRKREGTEITLSAEKIFDGTLSDGQFGFRLIGSDGYVLQTKSNAADGTITFDPISYTEPGTYTYYIEEVIGGDKSIAYDSTRYTAVVTVSAPSDLTSPDGLSASVTYMTAEGAAEKAVFTNKTKTLPEIKGFGTKLHNGSPAKADAFSFVIEQISVLSLASDPSSFSYTPIPGTAVEYANGADGIIDFSDYLASEVIAMIEEINESDSSYNSSRYYRIGEVAGTDPSIVYDDTAYMLLLNVVTTPESESYLLDVVVQTEKGEPVFSKFSSPSVEITADLITFSNLSTVRAEIPFEKVIESDNADALGDTYEFVLVDESRNEVIKTITGEGSDSFSFTYTYNDIGTHIYALYEVRGSNPSLFYDDRVYVINITVSADADGVLSADVSYSDTEDNEYPELVFTNKDLDPTHLHLYATKTLNDEVPAANERFPFSLILCETDGTQISVIETVESYRGNITFTELVFDSIGTYNYIIKEVLPEDDDPDTPGIQKDGYTYDETEYAVTVVVTDEDNDGTLEKAVTLNGQPVSAEGNHLTVGSFSNYYDTKPVTVSLGGTKVLHDMELDDQMFAFHLEAYADAPVPASTYVYADANGNFSFGDITFNEAGTYRYEVFEDIPEEAVNNLLDGISYDASVLSVVVTVTDNKLGELVAVVTVDGKAYSADTLKFENRYDALPVSVRFLAEKVLSGRNLSRNEFSFRLVEIDSAGNEISGTEMTATNGVYQSVSLVYFDFIEYTEPGTHTYLIEEILPADDDPETEGIQYNGVTYGEAQYTVSVEVTDNGTGNLVLTVDGNQVSNYYDVGDFHNSYSYTETSVNPEITKVLSGRNWRNIDQFVFVISAADRATESAVAEKTVVITQSEATVDLNTPDNKVVFDDIIFHAPGVYNFRITEKTGNAENMEYDDHALNVTVTVTDNGLGDLVADMDYFGYTEFTNIYTPTALSVPLTATKDLSGRELYEGEFTFNLYDEDGNLLQTKTNDEYGTVNFDPIQYAVAREYRYTITEAAGDLGGITYDRSVCEVTVTVTYDPAAGVLNAETEYISGGIPYDTAVFNNTYVPEPATASAYGKKLLGDAAGSGKTITGGEFLFAINPDASNPEGDPVSFSNTITNSADGSIVFFENAVYEKAGTYIYTVTEIDNGIAGMNYDAAVYKITVTVTDDGEGQLHTGVRTEPIGQTATTSEIVFTNTFDPEDTTAIIHGHKFLTGNHKNLEDGEFTFTLTEVDAEGNPVPGGVYLETTNSSTGIYQFSAITYDTVGTYYYVIDETEGQEAGYTYDTGTHTVKVTVTEKDGALAAEVENGMPVDGYDEYENVFVNHYEPAPTSIRLSAAKELDNGVHDRSLAAGEFSFVLKDATGIILQTKTNDEYGTVTFDSITFDKAGAYIYTVSESVGGLGGITYDKAVYTATVTVTDMGGALSAETVITLDGDNVNEIVFVNTYAPEIVSVTFDGTKTLTGRTLYTDEFTFVLRDASGAVIERVNNSADGSFAFSPISYDRAGTHTYTVSETKGSLGGVTYDETVYTVTVKITDDFAGKLHAEVEITSAGEAKEAIVFSNEYIPAPTEVVFIAKKTLAGRDLHEGEFTFELRNGNGELIESVTNGGKGEIRFAPVTFDKTGTYSFTVSEVSGNLNGVTYDASVYSAIVTVTDDGKGKLIAFVSENEVTSPIDLGSFDNSYVPDPVKTSLEGTKKLINEGFEDRKLLAGEFEFVITAVTDGAPLPSKTTVKNSEDGSFAFGEMVYTEAGTYEYLITEKTGTLGGITYDTREIGVTVEVTYDSATGLLSEPEVTISEDEGIVFTNTYIAEPTEAVIEGTKTLTGRDLNAGEFSFVLSDSEGNVIETVTNAADGSFAFSSIEYTAAGTHVYTVSETAGTLGGVTYDSALYTVTVEITDDLAGKLVSRVTYSADGTEKALAEFTNVYKPASTEAQFGGTKVLTGKPLSEDDFTFALLDSDGAVLQTATNSGDGSFLFRPIRYAEAGTYTYTVSEVRGSIPGVTYDETKYTVTVTVTDDLVGQLHAEVKILSGEEEKDSILFTNCYVSAPVSVELEAQKKYIGGLLRNGDFSFVLADPSGRTIEIVKNDKDGAVSFSPITYTEPGTYEYMIYEQGYNRSDIIYDSTFYRVVVVVTEDFENGVLVAEVTCYENGKPVDEALFVNRRQIDPPIDRDEEPNPDTGAPVF